GLRRLLTGFEDTRRQPPLAVVGAFADQDPPRLLAVVQDDRLHAGQEQRGRTDVLAQFEDELGSWHPGSVTASVCSAAVGIPAAWQTRQRRRWRRRSPPDWTSCRGPPSTARC